MMVMFDVGCLEKKRKKEREMIIVREPKVRSNSTCSVVHKHTSRGIYRLFHSIWRKFSYKIEPRCLKR